MHGIRLYVSAKTLTGCLKEIHRECGLEIDSVSNKSGMTTCVTRMCSKGMPPEVGMKITGHKSHGAYNRYNRAVDAQVRATQRSAGDGSAYVVNIEVETGHFKKQVITGNELDDAEDLSPNKKRDIEAANGRAYGCSGNPNRADTRWGGCLDGRGELGRLHDAIRPLAEIQPH